MPISPRCLRQGSVEHPLCVGGEIRVYERVCGDAVKDSNLLCSYYFILTCTRNFTKFSFFFWNRFYVIDLCIHTMIKLYYITIELFRFCFAVVFVVLYYDIVINMVVKHSIFSNIFGL